MPCVSVFGDDGISFADAAVMQEQLATTAANKALRTMITPRSAQRFYRYLSNKQLSKQRGPARTRALKHAREYLRDLSAARFILRGEAGFFRAVDVEHAGELAVPD